MLRPVHVASAAPVTPKRGNGPTPKIRQGSSIRLMMFETHSSRMAMAASPAPRKIALLRKSRTTAQLPPSAMRAYQLPVAMMSGVAPISAKQIGREDEARHSDRYGNDQAEEDSLHPGDRRAFGVFLSNAPRDHGGGRQAESHTDGKHQAQHGLGQTDGSNRVCAQPSDPEDVDDGKQRFENHLQHHGHGQKQDGAVEAAGGVILVRAADRFHQGRPQCVLFRVCAGDSNRHKNLRTFRTFAKATRE